MHSNYDRCFVITELINWIIGSWFNHKENAHEQLCAYVNKEYPESDKITPTMISIMHRYAPIALIMNNFFLYFAKKRS